MSPGRLPVVSGARVVRALEKDGFDVISTKGSHCKLRRGDYDLGDLDYAGAADGVTTFRPSEDQAVLAVAAGDRDAVEAQLPSQLGDLLCVVTSPWTEADVDAIRAHVHAHWAQWNLYELGPLNGKDGQTRMGAQLTRVLPEIADRAAQFHSGILALNPWLRHAVPELAVPA